MRIDRAARCDRLTATVPKLTSPRRGWAGGGEKPGAGGQREGGVQIRGVTATDDAARLRPRNWLGESGFSSFLRSSDFRSWVWGFAVFFWVWVFVLFCVSGRT